MRHFHKPVSLLLLISLVLNSFSAPANAAARSRAAGAAKQTDEADQEEGLRFRLSQTPDKLSAAGRLIE